MRAAEWFDLYFYGFFGVCWNGKGSGLDGDFGGATAEAMCRRCSKHKFWIGISVLNLLSVSSKVGKWIKYIRMIRNPPI